MARKSINWKNFVSTWEKSNSVREVAETLGIKASSVNNRAFQYLTKGIQLKKMRHGNIGIGHALDVDKINEYVISLQTANEEK